MTTAINHDTLLMLCAGFAQNAPDGVRIALVKGVIVLTSTRTGRHSIDPSVSSLDRVVAHLAGFVENHNNAK